ncbi:MAG: YfhO family protein, partial [Blastocatellia bacterium]
GQDGILSHNQSVGQDGLLSRQPKIERYEANRIELTTENPQNGFLVLSETYYDGWEARIDGQPAKIYRTDYTLRGVAVPAGRHGIEFVYRPRTLRLGAMGAALGLILLCLSYPLCCKRTRIFAGGETRSLN